MLARPMSVPSLDAGLHTRQFAERQIERHRADLSKRSGHVGSVAAHGSAMPPIELRQVVRVEPGVVGMTPGR